MKTHRILATGGVQVIERSQLPKHLEKHLVALSVKKVQ